MSLRLFGSLSARRQNGLASLRSGSSISPAALLLPVLVFLAGCGGGGRGFSSTAARPPSPAVALSSTNLDFGATRVGTTSAPRSVTITNNGNMTLTLSGIAIGGTNAGVFSQTNNCGNSLSAGSNCAVNVTFAPPTNGSLSASLTVTDSASGSPQIIGLSGIGSSVTGVAHGMFILDPPVSDAQCSSPLPDNCYSQHLVQTLLCSGAGAPVGYNCAQPGAGEPYIEGAVFHVPWKAISPSNGTYDFSQVDKWIQPWSDAGKLASFVFEPASFGTSNSGTPPWYLTPVNLSSVSETNGIITVNTTAAMGFFPGGIRAAAGLEIQIAGTGTALDGNGSPANPGIWVVCDHTVPGCQDPSSQTITAIGLGADIPAVSNGTVGNPVYGSSDGSKCTSGIIPIEWRLNFIKAWQDVIAQAVAHYGSNTNVAYMRFGMGIGGQTNPTYGLSASDPHQTACQKQMTIYGFTSFPVTLPWPLPSDPQWTTEISPTWDAYLKAMLQYEQSLHSPTAIIITLSGIQFGPDDPTTPDTTAQNSVAVHIGLGNQGLQKSDPMNFAAGTPCSGGDWCSNFQKYQGQVPLELQTLSISDPTNASDTGSLAVTLPFATSHFAKILELYVDDWMCTYDSAWNGNNTSSQCTAAGYPSVFSAAAAQIN